MIYHGRHALPTFSSRLYAGAAVAQSFTRFCRFSRDRQANGVSIFLRRTTLSPGFGRAFFRAC